MSTETLNEARCVDIAESRVEAASVPALDGLICSSASVGSITEMEPAHGGLMKLSAVRAEEIQWLWPGMIAMGELTVFAGVPGCGKSLVTSVLSAWVSRGLKFPGSDQETVPGDVVIYAYEDAPAQTIRPRVEAAGGDLDRIHVWQPSRLVDEPTSPMAGLLENIRTLPGVRLVIIDPITEFLDGAAMHSNRAVRKALAPLTELAKRTRTAIICVTHTSKSSGSGPVARRVLGSTAFTAVPRSVLMLAADASDRSRRMLVVVKSNLAPTGLGIGFRVEAAPCGGLLATWETTCRPVDVGQDMLVRDGEDENPRAKAAQWLQVFLRDGAMDVVKVLELAKASGHAEKTVRRAADEIGVKKTKKGVRGGWAWKLPARAEAMSSPGTVAIPPTPEPTPEPVSTPEPGSGEVPALEPPKVQSPETASPSLVEEAKLSG